MKGIILAGDSGPRLHPLTLGVPKQLIHIYDKPMIYYPIDILVKAGITELLVITTESHQPFFRKSIGDGEQFGGKVSYAIQNDPNGIADAINIAADFIGKDGVCLITGDTIIDGPDFSEQIKKSIRAVRKSGKATIFVENKTYEDQYGRVVMDKDRKPLSIMGDVDASHYYSIASIYVFPSKVVDVAKEIMPSERGRYEILDVNKRFFEECKLQVQVLDSKCIWFDTNTFDNILKSSNYMKQKQFSNR